MLALIWWMYAGYAWLTNSISTRGLRQRAILLGGMAGYLVLALAVPGAFDGSGLAFGVGYLIVVSVHASLFIWTASAQSSRAFLGIAPYNLFNALLVVVGGALGGTAQAVLWTVARAARVDPRRGWRTARARAASRSRPRTSSSATGWWSSSRSASRSWPAVSAPRAWPVNAELVLAAVLGLLLSAGLWWAYFGADDDAQAERALAAAPARRPVDRPGGLRHRALLPAAGDRPRRGRASRRPSATPTTRSPPPRRSRWAAASRSSSPPTSRSAASWASAARRTAPSRPCWRWPPSRWARVAAVAQLGALVGDPRRGARRRGRRALAARAERATDA